MVYAEGNTYNILSQEITHSDHFQTLQNEICNRSLNKFKAREIFQQTINETSTKNDLTKEERKLNRVSYQRWERSIDRGYDPITSQKLSSAHLNPLARRPATVWEKLHVRNQDTIPFSRPGTVDQSHSHPPGRYDISQNHGLNLDLETEEGMKYGKDTMASNQLQASKSLSQFPITHPPPSDLSLHKSSSTPILRPMTEATGMTTERGRVPSSSSRVKHTIPSLDLAKTTMSVRTGGIGEY